LPRTARWSSVGTATDAILEMLRMEYAELPGETL
jgi:hypothetical protein